MNSQTFNTACPLYFSGITAGSTVSASCAFTDESLITPGAPLAVYITVYASKDGGASYAPIGQPRSVHPVAVPEDSDIMVQVLPADGPCIGTVQVDPAV